MSRQGTTYEDPANERMTSSQSVAMVRGYFVMMAGILGCMVMGFVLMFYSVTLWGMLIGMIVGGVEAAAIVAGLAGYYYVAIMMPISQGSCLSAQCWETPEKVFGSWLVSEQPFTEIPLDEADRIMPVRIPFGEFGKNTKKPEGSEGESDGLEIIEEVRVRCPDEKCVKGDTLILGDNHEIENTQIGSRCLGLNGLGTVTHTFKREYTGQMIRIKAHGLLPVEVTPEHPILVGTFSHKRGTRKCLPNHHIEKLLSIHYKPAKALQPRWINGKRNSEYDCLIIPNLKGATGIHKLDMTTFASASGYKNAITRFKLPTSLPLNEDSAWLLGLYVAEGNYAKNGAVFNLGSHEVEIEKRLLQTIRELGLRSWIAPSPETSRVIYIRSTIIARAFKEWCGNLAAHKQIPEFILLHNDLKIVQAFLDGYLAGDACDDDGYNNHTGGYYVATTVSRLLALQLQLLVVRLGQYATVHINRKVHFGLGECTNLRDQYYVHVRKYPYQNQQFKRANGVVLAPIRQLTQRPYIGAVFNLETSDNTYLVNNVAVHNCQYHFKDFAVDHGQLYHKFPFLQFKTYAYVMTPSSASFQQAVIISPCKIDSLRKITDLIFFKGFPAMASTVFLSLTRVFELDQHSVFGGPVYVVNFSSWHVEITQQLAGFTPAYMIPNQEQIIKILNLWGIREALQLMQQIATLKAQVESLQGSQIDFDKGVEATAAHIRKQEDLMDLFPRRVGMKWLKPKVLALIIGIVIAAIVATYLLATYVFK